MEAQVQLDQQADRLDLLAREAQRLHALGSDLGPDDVVVVEGDRAVRDEAAGLGLADVVHQRGEAGHEVGSAARKARLEVDRLLEDGEGVLVDVLVSVVLVALEAQRRQLGQDEVGQPGLHEQGEAQARVGRTDQLDQLVAHALGGDDVDPLGHVRHRRDDLGRDVEAELGGEPGGAQHPQRVVAEGVLGTTRGPQDPVGQVGDATEGILEGAAGQAHRHRVDGEVAATQVAGEVVAEGDRRVPRGRVVALGAVRRHLDHPLAAARADGAEVAPHVPQPTVAPGPQQLLGLLRPGRGGEVEVVMGTPQHGVTHRPADQVQLVAGLGEALTQLVEHGRQAVELPLHAGLDLHHRELLARGRTDRGDRT